jgi:hypothetical protein
MKQSSIQLFMACLADTVSLANAQTKPPHNKLGKIWSHQKQNSLLLSKLLNKISMVTLTCTDCACISFCHFAHHKHDILAGITFHCETHLHTKWQNTAQN